MVAADAPLYLGCPCKQQNPVVAQLMRIHVVTPKAPVSVTLNPQVIPCPDGPTFYPGWPDPIKLPISTYWVLRLPLIYWGEEGSHLPPAEVPDPKFARLLKRFLSYVED